MKVIRSLLVVACLAACIGILIFFSGRVSESSLYGAFDGSENGKPLVTALIGFITTVTGVFIGSLYRRLLKLKEGGAQSVNVKKLVPEVVTSIDLMIGLISSPIVFGLLWQSLESLQLSGLIVICLQNGFACNSVIGAFINKKAEENQ